MLRQQARERLSGKSRIILRRGESAGLCRPPPRRNGAAVYTQTSPHNSLRRQRGLPHGSSAAAGYKPGLACAVIAIILKKQSGRSKTAPGRTRQRITAGMAAGKRERDNSAVSLLQLRRPACRPVFLRQAQTQPHKHLRRWQHSRHFSRAPGKNGEAQPWRALKRGASLLIM